MSIILSLLTGGATGLLGTIVSGILRYFATRQQQKYELEKMEMDFRHMSAEAEHAERIASIEAEAATHFSTGAHPALVWVDVVRGLMRPALTLGLVILVGVVFFKAGSDIDTSSLDTII